MDLTGIFTWLNDLSAWIAGFFTWLGVELQAVILAGEAIVRDGLFRLTMALVRLLVAVIAGLGLPSINFSSSVTALGASAVDVLLAANVPSSLATVMAVVVFKWILRIIPLPWRA